MKRSAVRSYDPGELEFMRAFMLAIGARPNLRIHRQNCGQIPIRDREGKVIRYFDAGPPNGASDVSGVIAPEGWRLEIELKSSTGTRSADQIRWAEMIEMFGGVYALVQYDPTLTLAQNVDLAGDLVLAAIERRRRRAA